MLHLDRGWKYVPFQLAEKKMDRFIDRSGSFTGFNHFKTFKKKIHKNVAYMVKEAEKLLKQCRNATYGPEVGGSWPPCFKWTPSRLQAHHELFYSSYSSSGGLGKEASADWLNHKICSLKPGSVFMVFSVPFDGGDTHQTSGPHQLLESVITLQPEF